MIMIILFLLSIVVWLGAGLVMNHNHWTDIIKLVDVPIGGNIEQFNVPGIGMLIYIVIGMGILYIADKVLQSSGLAEMDKIYRKDDSGKLAIQQFGAAIHADSMNENMEPVVAWLPLWLSRGVIAFFIYKLIIALIIFALAIVVRLILNALGYQEMSDVMFDSLKAISFWLFRFGIVEQGMVLLGYAIIVVYAYALYKHERIFIRDYAIMQKQIG
jgi:hypothetical protein